MMETDSKVHCLNAKSREIIGGGFQSSCLGPIAHVCHVAKKVYYGGVPKKLFNVLALGATFLGALLWGEKPFLSHRGQKFAGKNIFGR